MIKIQQFYFYQLCKIEIFNFVDGKLLMNYKILKFSAYTVTTGV